MYLKRTVLGVGIFLTTDEALRFVKDPEKAQREVGAMLRGGGIDPETGRPMPGIMEGTMDGAFGAGREGSVVAQLAGMPAGSLRLVAPSRLATPAINATAKKSHHKGKPDAYRPKGLVEYVCAECQRAFETAQGLGLHRTRMHKGTWGQGNKAGRGKDKGTNPNADARAAREQAQADMRAEGTLSKDLPEDEELPPEVANAIREALDGDDLEGSTAPGE